MAEFIDLTGQRFGRLTVLRRGENQGTFACWVCQCDCGRIITSRGTTLRNNTSTSCGCKRIESIKARATHNMSSSPEYFVWSAMRQRCKNPNDRFYSRYGGRGITVCSRWHKFENFYNDMGARPSPKHSIDRINNDGDYEPSNCRWATPSEQMSNRNWTK